MRAQAALPAQHTSCTTLQITVLCLNKESPVIENHDFLYLLYYIRHIYNENMDILQCDLV